MHLAQRPVVPAADRRLALLLLLAVTGCVAPGTGPGGAADVFVGASPQDDKGDVVGPDDRTPVAEAERYAPAARSVGYITRIASLDFLDNAIGLDVGPLGERYDLCPEERFVDVGSARGFGTGVLVGPNLVATAGHVLHHGKDLGCEEVAFVVGHTLEAGGVIPEADVYRCVRLVARRLPLGLGGTAAVRESSTVPDYALFEIEPLLGEADAAAPPWVPLGPPVEEGEEVAALGHPLGLPLIVSRSSVVRDRGAAFFLTHADVSGGNSGGPLLDPALRLRGIVAAELQPSLAPRGAECRTIAVSDEGCDDCGTLITRLDPMRAIVEAWPEDAGVQADASSIARLAAGRNVLPLAVEGEGDAAQVLVEAWFYDLDGRASVRLAHESGCRSPILRPERTGTDGYTVIAQSLTHLAGCPIEGEWRLEIDSPRARGQVHRWRLTAFDR